MANSPPMEMLVHLEKLERLLDFLQERVVEGDTPDHVGTLAQALVTGRINCASIRGQVGGLTSSGIQLVQPKIKVKG